MAIDLTVAMPTKVGPATAAWPYGEPRNVSAPSAGDGTPWRSDLGKDFVGFIHSLLVDGGVTPNGTSDTANASQINDALREIIRAFPDMDEVIFNDKLTASGAVELPIEQDVIGFTGSNNDVVLTNADTQANFNIVATDALTFTGIGAPDTTTDSRLRIIRRSGGTSLTLTNEDGSSAAANRMSLPGGNDINVADGEFVALLYNPNLARYEMLWRSQQVASIPAGSVNQGALDTSQGQVSSGSTTRTNLILPGGEYGMYPRVRTTDPAGGEVTLQDNNFISSSFATRVTCQIQNVASGDCYAQQRYINASPPYDMGNGVVPLFVFLQIIDGKVVNSYIADAPPWAYNGPTNIAGTMVTTEEDIEEMIPAPLRGTLTRDDKGRLQKVIEATSTEATSISRKLKRSQRMRQKIITEFTLEEVTSGSITMEQFSNQKVTKEWVPVDYAFKNSDMSLIPHPFPDATDGVIMLDPVGTEKLFELHGQEVNIMELIRKGYITIGDKLKGVTTPEGVVAHRFSFKNT